MYKQKLQSLTEINSSNINSESFVIENHEFHLEHEPLSFGNNVSGFANMGVQPGTSVDQESRDQASYQTWFQTWNESTFYVIKYVMIVYQTMRR